MENLQELKPVGKLTPFAHFCCTIGNLPTSYMISLTYEEQLLWLCQYLEKTVIPAVNTNAESVAELQNLYIQLKEYVDNYFNNLDVQEEINNKLDEMAESGELQAIIESFLQLNSLMCFDTIADLKQATNLIAGSFAKTLGYYSINDGGSALYKIVDNTETLPNDMTVIEIANNLYAILIYDKSNINVKQMGAHGDGETDDLSIINNIINLIESGSVLYFPNGNYIFSNPLNITKTIEIKGTSYTNNTGTTFTFNNTNGIVMKASYIKVKNINITGTNRNDNIIDLDNNIYGIMGVVNQYTDDYSNGGCSLENCNVHGFNIGVAIFSTRVTQSKWSGAYRTFKNCYINYNQIGYLIKDGATFNSIIGGTISSNTKHGIYAETETYYQNIEVVDTAMEMDGVHNGFSDELFTDFGIYAGKDTKIKFTNSYLEQLYAFVNDGGIIELLSTHVHSNVCMFGFGQILSESSHAPYKTKMPYSIDFATRSTNSNLTVSAPYSSSPYARLQCNTNTQPRLNFPNMISVPLAMQNLEWCQLDFDIKIDNGYQVENLAIRPQFEIVGYVSGNRDGGNIANTYAPKNVKINDNNWHHFTMFWRPRIGTTGYIADINDMIYRLSVYLFLCDTLSDSTQVDFSTNNLDAKLTNPVVTIYGKTFNAFDNDLIYLKSLLPSS